jgi:hypothetical protein
MQKACIDNMNSTQLVRLHQITLQSFGPKSLLDPKIGSSVGLTVAQTNKLKVGMDNLAAAQQSAGLRLVKAGMATESNVLELAKKTRQQSQALLSTVLTSRQMTKWKALQGKPFRLSGMAALMGGG